MGLDRDRALGAIRLSLGQWTTPDDVNRASDLLAAATRRQGACGGPGNGLTSTPRDIAAVAKGPATTRRVAIST